MLCKSLKIDHIKRPPNSGAACVTASKPDILRVRFKKSYVDPERTATVWASDTGCQYRPLLGNFSKLEFQSSERRAGSRLQGARFVSQRKFGNGPCIYAGIELSTVAQIIAFTQREIAKYWKRKTFY